MKIDKEDIATVSISFVIIAIIIFSFFRGYFARFEFPSSEYRIEYKITTFEDKADTIFVIIPKSKEHGYN